MSNDWRRQVSFWEEHAEREAVLAPPPEPSAQNAPTKCVDCGHVGADVLLGICDRCAVSRACF